MRSEAGHPRGEGKNKEIKQLFTAQCVWDPQPLLADAGSKWVSYSSKVLKKLQDDGSLSYDELIENQDQEIKTILPFDHLGV